MDKCWFVLRQTHYTAPQYESPSMAFGKAEGPLRLGHLLPGPRAVDNIINTDGVIPFPKAMRITKSNTPNFSYSRHMENTTDLTTGAGAPIAAAAGVTLDVEAGVLFRRMMGDTWNIDRLETQIVQPTLSYIEQCRASPELASWIARHKTLGAWKLYIITGLMIARGASSERSDARERGKNAGVGADVPGVVNVKAGFNNSRKEETKVSGDHPDDFVWAIRLSRISKVPFGDMEIDTYIAGAALAPGSEQVDVNAVLDEEGLLSDELNIIEVVGPASDGAPEPQFFVTIDDL